MTATNNVGAKDFIGCKRFIQYISALLKVDLIVTLLQQTDQIQVSVVVDSHMYILNINYRFLVIMSIFSLDL